MIVITGGAGFIGSALAWRLNEEGLHNLVIVDELGTDEKWQNLAKRRFLEFVHKDNFFHWLEAKSDTIDAVFHMGACSTTTETDADFLMANNVHYSAKIFSYCTDKRIPLIYASSAATYGARESGFADDHATLHQLRPINKYGFSKQVFDCWVLDQKTTPPFWAGLKFFNVYGPNEYHKGPQASVVWHAFPQIRNEGQLKLFKSYRPNIAHGEQMRDFVYVKDVVDVMWHLYKKQKTAKPGIYNLGTGTARSFIDLGNAVFAAMGKKDSRFEWIPMPENIKNQYQYFTQADLSKLVEKAGYRKPFTKLEDGIADYVQNFLLQNDPYL